jgi:class 3 adenylate cyclase/tetratricopeptide (TPR) repeat protein
MTDIALQEHKRVLTIVFCDLAGSVEMTAQFGAERAKDVLKAYRTSVSLIVRDAGGHVARMLGDGILCYFGYPAAREDDAARAVGAALAAITAVQRIDLDGKPLAVRIGIATGEVIIESADASASDTPPVIGNAVNLAARLQALAGPDGMLVDDATRRLAVQWYAFEPRGSADLKGLGPVDVFALARPRAQARHISQSPLVGRTAELAALRRAWDDARLGKGGTVLISGEPGIGKSRLSLEVADWARGSGAAIIRLAGMQAASDQELKPIRTLFAKAAKAARPAQLFALDPALRSLIDPEAPESEFESGPARRLRLFEAIWRSLARLTEARPCLVIVEDAQWLDPSTSALVAYVAVRIATCAALAVVTARREYFPAWVLAPYVIKLAPRRLGPAETEEIVRAILGARPESEVKAVAGLAQGVPFFAEELAKEVRDRGPGALSGPLPLTLQSVLLGRLERLGPTSHVAQVAACIGLEFRHDDLAAVIGADETQLARELRRLMEAEVILPKTVQAGARYAFRHVLLRDAAYNMILTAQRKDLHRAIAALLESRRDATADDRPELVAWHKERAGDLGTASRFWLVAGQRAVARGAVTEAVAHFKAGLAALSAEPPTEAAKRLAFDLNLNLGPALMANEGYASAEAARVFADARAQLRYASSSLDQIQVLLGIFNVHFSGGHLRHARAVAQQADGVLRDTYGGYPVLLGQTLCAMGRFPGAKVHLERALALYDPAIDRRSGMFARADLIATSFLAKTEFALGNVEGCAALTEKAAGLAAEHRHPIAIAIANVGRMFLALETGQLDKAKELADIAHDHAVDSGLEDYRIWVSFYRAALSLASDPAGAIARMSTLLHDPATARNRTFRAGHLALLGASKASVGDLKGAFSALDEGIATAFATGATETLPALFRLRARAHQAAKRRDAAHADIRKALRLATAQQNRVECLRAASLLLKLTEGSPTAADARARLSDIVKQFPAGGTRLPDLVRARKLVADTDHPPSACGR